MTFPEGDMNKCLFAPDGTLTMNQRNDSTQIQLGEPMSCLGYLQEYK